MKGGLDASQLSPQGPAEARGEAPVQGGGSSHSHQQKLRWKHFRVCSHPPPDGRRFVTYEFLRLLFGLSAC